MTTQKSHSTDTLTQEKLSIISDRLCDRIDELFGVLGVDLKQNNKMYFGSCPVHGGDRFNALNLYYEGNVRGNWKCNTHQCQEVFMSTIIGFIRGVLSHQHYGWQTKGDKVYSFGDTLKFIEQFLQQKLDDVHVNLAAVEKKRVTDYTTRYFNRQKKICKPIPRSLVRPNLTIPAQYYLDRNYTFDVLNKYDIGLCDNPSRPMFNRIVVPIYDDDYKNMVGCTARSIFEKCPVCEVWHNPKSICPLDADKWRYSKWKHSDGFHAEEWLYNFWFAKDAIWQTKTAVIVESPGNVWRLEEAGIHNALGIFGSDLCDGQLDVLNKCGALHVVLAMDNDKAGEDGTKRIQEKLSKLYGVTVIKPSANDIGDLPVDVVKRDIVPAIENAYLK